MYKLLLPATAALALAGCQGIRDQSGYIALAELTDSIEVGIDNKDSVQRTLGRPTFTGQFDENNWYYVNQMTSQFAFRRPQLKDATILHIQFDAAGNVTSINEADETLAVKINPSGDETPTLGREKSFFEELFGNIGQVGQTGLFGTEQGGP
ncbi:outer membrane protein assembly factor BamE [Sphingomicrobium clamense]|uniref:Outer membrane protein assembly factor BamE n=1 Tax=Sphingomicrobium clamense TaxID=2851013 RepID=A0ABS6V2T7_9SPHN|nr:outer membrane protein assembly factor BamE [Sphingomicrobium sp. B8]MBW0143878.1 outer membrane protein assembly factor BamE [Sphingomicrobium sp. B8]